METIIVPKDFDSGEFISCSFMLEQEIALADRENDEDLKNTLRKYFGGEGWNSIQKKMKCKGCTWYVWWSEAVQLYWLDLLNEE